MSRSLQVVIAPGPQVARVLAAEGPGRTVLKAHLAPGTMDPQAVPRLLEALALWEGAPVHAVMAVDEWDASCARALYPGVFTDGGTRPGFVLDLVPVARVHRGQGYGRRVDPARLGDFADLRRLVWPEVSR
jgi:hypothetical protein